MKNTLLFILLIILLCVGYFLDLNEKKEVMLLDKKEITEIVQISTTNYTLNKVDKKWQINKKSVDISFMKTFVGVLRSLVIVKKCSSAISSFSELALKSKDSETKLKLAQKAIGDNGFYIYKDDQCYLVRNEFTEGLVYSDDQDRGQKQYYMLQNIFNFKEADFKL